MLQATERHKIGCVVVALFVGSVAILGYLRFNTPKREFGWSAQKGLRVTGNDLYAGNWVLADRSRQVLVVAATCEEMGGGVTVVPANGRTDIHFAASERQYSISIHDAEQNSLVLAVRDNDPIRIKISTAEFEHLAAQLNDKGPDPTIGVLTRLAAWAAENKHGELNAALTGLSGPASKPAGRLTRPASNVRPDG